MRKALSLLLAVAATTSAAAADRVGPGVREAVREDGRARVTVSLAEPRATAILMRSAQIREEREAVVATLPHEDLEITRAWDLVPGFAGWVTEAGLERLVLDPGVVRIDLEPTARAHMAEAVPLVHADEVQALGFSGGGITVAVLDTGIDVNHADFSGRIVDQACFCTNGAGAGCCPGGGTTASGAGSAQDDNGHGTNVAGVIAGNGSVAPRGMAPNANLVIVKVLGADGSGGSSSIVSGLEYIAKNRPEVKVVNLSLGLGNLFPGTCDSSASFTQQFASVINTLKGRGTAVFASTGNSANATQIAVPACIAAAIAVGAVYDGDNGSISFGCTDASTRADQVTCFSNSSPAQDLLAPGGGITASGLGGGASTFFGTSQACPAAAGVAAALLSANPGASVDRLESALKSTGVSITDTRNGQTFRRINARAALDQVR